MSEEIDDIEENGSVEEGAPVADGTEQGAQESEAEDPADTDESASDGSSAASSDEPSSEDCPPCNKGAPAWMATFADMATLLMAFFVLILSFSDTEIRKFEQINGSLQNAFGIKKIRPTIQIPRGRALLVQDYSPALSERTVINDPNQLHIDPAAE